MEQDLNMVREETNATPVKSVCVFCGSRTGSDPAMAKVATRFGEEAGAVGLHVIYGGGHVGLMGLIADATMAAGGRVTGLIPERLLTMEVGHRHISELIVTEGMFDRKDEMIRRADAFVVLPGGLGTLDELFEVLTLRQLGYHRKPIVLVNTGGFWDPLMTLIDRVIEEVFAEASAIDLMTVVDDVPNIWLALGLAQPQVTDKSSAKDHSGDTVGDMAKAPLDQIG